MDVVGNPAYSKIGPGTTDPFEIVALSQAHLHDVHCDARLQSGHKVYPAELIHGLPG